MSIYLRTMELSDLDEVLAFEQAKLQETIADEAERTFSTWKSRWRREALEHYLPMGWCFLARDKELSSTHSSEGLLVGYFLAQPLLFFDGQTQTLWIEHMQFATLQARDELCDLAYRLSREKHFQKVLFPESPAILNAIKPLKAQSWDPAVLSVLTTKVSE